jgi:hypothetical protein
MIAATAAAGCYSHPIPERTLPAVHVPICCMLLQLCAGRVCQGTQYCTDAGICCNSGEVACAGQCCGGGYTCLQGQYCMLAGVMRCTTQIAGHTAAAARLQEAILQSAHQPVMLQDIICPAVTAGCCAA